MATAPNPGHFPVTRDEFIQPETPEHYCLGNTLYVLGMGGVHKAWVVSVAFESKDRPGGKVVYMLQLASGGRRSVPADEEGRTWATTKRELREALFGADEEEE